MRHRRRLKSRSVSEIKLLTGSVQGEALNRGQVPRLMHTSFLGKVHFMPSTYDPETRAKAVRLVLELREDYPSEWAAITAVSNGWE